MKTFSRLSSRSRILLAGVSLASPLLVLGLVSGDSPAAPARSAEHQDGHQATALESLSQEFRDIASRVEPSVVHIEVREAAETNGLVQINPEDPGDLLQRFFGGHGFFGEEPPQQQQQQNPYQQYDVPERVGAGSGWVYDGDGHIVTNNHVVENATEIDVRFHDGTQRKAHVVATDPQTDIAVVQVDDVKGLVPAKVSADKVAQGDIVFTFGSPLRFSFSMSQGIVAGVGRHVGILGPQGYENFIQTDAAINPGNSGGPLVDVDGRVVGMNSAIATRSGFFSGVGFAIPSTMIEPVVKQLIENGKVSRGYLGISIQDAQPGLLQSFGYQGKGVLVGMVVPGGAAEDAGLKRGDIVTSIDGHEVETADELRELIASDLPGTKIDIRYWRDGNEQQAEAKLEEMPKELASNGGSSQEIPFHAHQRGEDLMRLGLVRVSELTPQLARQLDTDTRSGVVVEQVRAHSIAAEAGLSQGAVITEVGDTQVTTPADLEDALSSADLGQGVRLTVEQDGGLRYVFLQEKR